MRINDQTSLTEFYCEPSGLSSLEILKLKEIMEENEQEIGQIGGSRGSTNENVRRSNIVWLDQKMFDRYQCYDIYNKLCNILDSINERCFKFDLFGLENPQLTKYDSSTKGFYDMHMDCANYQHNTLRKLSMVIQLSDLDDFEGGDFMYYSMLEKRDVNVSKERPELMGIGQCIVFPSFINHGVTPVTKGVRYSLVCWGMGPRFR